MKALGIVGSYRKGGINDTAVETILQGVASRGVATEKILLVNKKIHYCRNCRSCVQQPGTDPGRCVIEDDVPDIIRKALDADILILSSPVTFGSITAVTKAFLERTVCLAYWPWGKPAPRLRQIPGRRLAVLVTSSAAPALLARFGGYHALADLGKMAQTLHAEVVTRLHYGMMAVERNSRLSENQRMAAFQLGRSVVDRFEGTLINRLTLLVTGYRAPRKGRSRCLS